MYENKSHNNTIWLFVSSCWLIFSLILAKIHENATTIEPHNVLVVANVVSYVLCLYGWIKSGNRVISIYLFFVAYLFFSTIAQSVLYALGFSWGIAQLYNEYTLQQMNEYLCFNLTCIAAFNMGTALVVYKKSNCVTMESLVKYYCSRRYANNGSAESAFLTILTAVVWIYEILFATRLLLMRQTMTYSEVYENASEVGGSLGSYISYIALFLALINILQKKNVKWMYACLLLTATIFMLVGTRSRSIVLISIILITLPMVKPQWFKKKYMIGWFGVAVLFFGGLSVITSSRSSQLGSNTSASMDTFEDVSPVVSTMMEMGASAKTVVLTMEAVDAGFPHHQTILYSTLNAIIPGFNYTGVLANEYLQLAGWVTDYANSLFSGLGYSIIAEAYMNYGRYGWIFMILYGFILAYAEIFAYKKYRTGEYLIPVILLLLLSKNVFSVRGELALLIGYVRMAIYILIITLFYKSIKRW
ncbi:MAG: O-antigen polysaccharide polymerase Wzy [Alistipes sp.]|nr:O-antigen polysaccharide polymerase Wzy [Alistipes sp.]